MQKEVIRIVLIDVKENVGLTISGQADILRSIEDSCQNDDKVKDIVYLLQDLLRLQVHG